MKITVTEGQLNSLRRLVHESVAAAARVIANEAATAAVQALQSASPTTTRTLAAISDITPTDQDNPETCLHASPCQDIPASYVQDIHSGVFFELTKLLPKDPSQTVSRCHEFNRVGQCNRATCNYRHVCNRCSRPLSGCHCPTLHGKRDDLRDGDKGTPKSRPARRT